MRCETVLGQRSGSLVIIGLGVALLAFWLGYMRVHQHYLEVPLWLFLTGFIPVLALAAGLCYGGYWLHRRSYSADLVWEVTLWCFVGIAGSTSLMFGAIFYQVNIGVAINEPLFLLLMSGGVGANAGVLIGVYNASALRHVQRVKRARDTLAFLNRALRHNVLNASNIIQGYAELIASRNPEGQTGTYAQLIQNRSKHVVHHVDNVRLFAQRMENRGTFEIVDAANVIERELDVLRETYAEALVETDFQADVPVRVDDLFGAMITVLVGNAIERCDCFTPQVSVRLRTVDETAILSVADRGPILSAVQKRHLFEPGEHGEAGLDLYLVAELVADYGGTVDATDNDPRGTVISISLPTAN